MLHFKIIYLFDWQSDRETVISQMPATSRLGWLNPGAWNVPTRWQATWPPGLSRPASWAVRWRGAGWTAAVGLEFRFLMRWMHPNQLTLAATTLALC